jgi:hypothetical protein
MCVTKAVSHFNDLVMAKRDRRVGRMNELLSAIKLIKSNAWCANGTNGCQLLPLPRELNSHVALVCCQNDNMAPDYAQGACLRASD